MLVVTIPKGGRLQAIPAAAFDCGVTGAVWAQDKAGYGVLLGATVLKANGSGYVHTYLPTMVFQSWAILGDSGAIEPTRSLAFVFSTALKVEEVQ